ncbi:MAG: hypothetical protein RL641_684 [Candidatus Parcubacteria bacterium]|jgi:energy-coupling factor transporter ATP-binding protein EcfA2
MEDQEKITYFAQTDFRNKRANFGIKAKDRTRHTYVIGKTGMGKSTLLENMAAQDIMNGEGMAFMDPHGSAAEKLLEYVPEERVKDVVYFAPFDTDFPISFNILESVDADKRHLVSSGLMSVFKKIWADQWSARMEYILNNILLALLEYPNATLLGVNRMLADKDYRKAVVDNVKDPSVKSFWIDEFAKYGDRYMQEAGAAIQNKVGQFATNPVIRNIIGQPTSSFDIRKMMDEKKILIINLSKGRIGEQNANLLGGILITKIYLAAMSRADVSNEAMKRLPHFYLFVDEFQSFASDSFADILSEARKYHLSLTIAHQYVEQMSEAVQAAVFGNVGTMIIFRVGATDAEIFEKEFAPQFTAEDIVNLGIFQTYMRLMIDGVGSKPFSAVTMAPIPIPHRSFKDEITASSRASFALARPLVEEAIAKWHEPVVVIKKEKIVRDGDGFMGAPTNEIRPPRPFTINPQSPRPGASTYVRPQSSPVVTPSAPFTAKAPIGPRIQPKIDLPKSGIKPQASQYPPKREYVEPVRPKESLRSMLNKLSIEPERPKIVAEDITSEKIQTEKKTVQHVITAEHSHVEHKVPEPMSMSLLKKSKTPDAQKIADLRALLQKVVPQQHQKQPIAQPVEPPIAKNTLKNNAQSDKSADENPKEVPEEVLRSILSS